MGAVRASETGDKETVAGRPRRVSGQDDLLMALRLGDRRAAENLVGQTHEMIYASLFRLTGGDPELSEDLTQETYQKAWKALPGFDGRAQIGTWLYRIAYNSFLNHVRRPARVRPLEDAQVATLAASDPTPDEEAEDREAAERLRRAVLALPDELRFAVTARYWVDLSVREIARLQNITAPAVRKRLKRAYLSLELILEGESP